jgi:hypothetical protein
LGRRIDERDATIGEAGWVEAMNFKRRAES